jgi:hypothetical protein
LAAAVAQARRPSETSAQVLSRLGAADIAAMLMGPENHG